MTPNELEIVKRLTAAMREADRNFELTGGSTRHHIVECLLPALEKHGVVLSLVAAPESGVSE